MSRQERMKKLKEAFIKDGFLVKNNEIFIFQEDPMNRKEEKIGMIAHHTSAENYDTKESKKAYYVEGSPYEMGYLMGYMAEEEISEVTTKFVDKMADQFAQRVQERVGQPISHEEILTVMKKIAPTRLTIDIVVDKLRRQLQ